MSPVRIRRVALKIDMAGAFHQPERFGFAGAVEHGDGFAGGGAGVARAGYDQ